MPWIDGGSGFFRAKAVPSGLLPLSIGGIAALYGCGYFIAFLRRLSMACLLRPLFTEGLPYNKSNRTKGGEAVTVVYVDSVFVLNAAMDYLLLLVTGRLAGVPLRRRRYLAAALAGGAYAVAVFLPGWGFLAAPPVKLAAGVLLALAAFGGEERFLRLTLLLFAVSSTMAGCVLALGLLAGGGVPMVNGVFYTDVDARVLLISTGAAYLVLAVVFRASARHGVSGRLLPVRIGANGRTADLTALWDTGNALREPGSGMPVLVVAPGGLDLLLPEEARRLLSPEGLRSPADVLERLRQTAPGLHPRLIPYHAVGTPSGLLLAVRTDWAEVAGTRYPGLTAALSPTALGNGYTALWGGGIKRGGDHGSTVEKAAAAAGTSGAGAGGGDPLYRRQRYTAAAAEPGAGGGAGGAAGGRGGQERTH